MLNFDLPSQPTNPEINFSSEIEHFFERLPEELAERYLNDFDAKPEMTDEEKYLFLKRVFDKRKQALESKGPAEKPKHIEVSVAMPLAIQASIERSTDNKDQSFLGGGQTAEVLASLRQPTVCYKVFYDGNDQVGQSSLAMEVDLQIEVAETMADMEVKVPGVLSYIENDFGQAIMMEKVPGFSLRQIVEGGELLPEGFDFDSFSQKLISFIEEMNTKGYYHRDITVGNIMVGVDGEPWLIDFGRSKKGPGNNDDIYIQTNPQDPTSEIHFPNDQKYLHGVLAELNKHIMRSKLTQA